MARRGRPSRRTIVTQMEAAVAELHARLGGLPAPGEAEDIWSEIWVHEAHNSTATEGNTLVLREVEILLREHRAVGAKELKDYLEVKGYAAAARWVYSQALTRIGVPADSDTLLTMQEVRHIHHVAMGLVWTTDAHPDASENEKAGSFREHNINRFAGGMKPPNWTEVPMLMHDLVASMATARPERFPGGIAEMTAAAHARFERLHPFLDGNGRAGRLVANLVLVRLGYPPMIIDKRDRSKYLRALARADDGDVGPLTELFARAILASLNRFIIPAVAGPGKFVPITALASEKVTARALRNAAERGRLRAEKGTDGIWRSSRRLVNEYIRSRYQRQ